MGLFQVQRKEESQAENIFFLKMAYTLENNNFYLQPIHKLEQDMEENNCMQFVNKLNSSTFHIMIEFLDVTEKKIQFF